MRNYAVVSNRIMKSIEEIRDEISLLGKLENFLEETFENIWLTFPITPISVPKGNTKWFQEGNVSKNTSGFQNRAPESEESGKISEKRHYEKLKIGIPRIILANGFTDGKRTFECNFLKNFEGRTPEGIPRATLGRILMGTQL